jgi:hypothetical protein
MKLKWEALLRLPVILTKYVPGQCYMPPVTLASHDAAIKAVIMKNVELGAEELNNMMLCRRLRDIILPLTVMETSCGCAPADSRSEISSNPLITN